MTLNALIFDLDNTLAMTQEFHARAFGAVFAKRGLEYGLADDARYAGKGSACIFPEFFAEHRKTISEKEIKEMSEEKKKAYEQILHTSAIREVPGAKEFVHHMHDIGVKIAVASGNKMEAIEYILSRVGILPFVDAFMVNKYVEHSKPDPDIFLAAAKRLGVPVEECIVFEDATNGIIAAKEGGFRVIALTTTFDKKALKEAGADEVVGDYGEVGENLKTKNWKQ